MNTIEIEIEDDLSQVITMDVSYTYDRPEAETGFLGGYDLKKINHASFNVVASWVEDGELIINLDVAKIDMEELRDTIELEIEKVLS